MINISNKTRNSLMAGAAVMALMSAMGPTISNYLGYGEPSIPVTELQAVKTEHLSAAQTDRNQTAVQQRIIDRKAGHLQLSPKQIEAFKLAAQSITPKMEAGGNISPDNAAAFNGLLDAKMQVTLMSEARDPVMQSALAAARTLGDDPMSVQQLATQIIKNHNTHIEAQAARDAARKPSPTEAYDAAKTQSHREAGVNGPMTFPTPG